MDINLIESTFDELMEELGKIKDLNEVSDSYRQKLQLLSEQLERFLAAADSGSSCILEKAERIEKALGKLCGHDLPLLHASVAKRLENFQEQTDEHRRLMNAVYSSLSASLSDLREQVDNVSRDIRMLDDRTALKLNDVSVETRQLRRQVDECCDRVQSLERLYDQLSMRHERADNWNSMMQYIQTALLLVVIFLVFYLLFVL